MRFQDVACQSQPARQTAAFEFSSRGSSASFIESYSSDAPFISRLQQPPIRVTTMCTTWRLGSEELLSRAVEDIVSKVPVLAGRMVQTSQGIVSIEPSCFGLNDLYRFVDGSRLAASAVQSTSSPGTDRAASPDAIAKAVSSSIGTGMDQLLRNSPLFLFTVIQLDNNRACYVLQISRAIAHERGHAMLINMLKKSLVQQYCHQRDVLKNRWQQQ
eukprot:6212009-Pleurochrysis_carterae.AAC.1